MYSEIGRPGGSLDSAAAPIIVGEPNGSSPDVPAPVDGDQAIKPENPCLLWIDDEITPDDGAVLYLEFGGFQVHCAVTATAGLAMARTGRYSGILLDLRLPDMSGLAVLASLRAESITTPVVLLTGFGDFESARVAGRLGADGFHAKPLLGDDLLGVVQQIIRPASSADGGLSAGHRLSVGSRSGLSSLAALLEVFHRLEQATDRGLSRKHVSQTLVGALVQTLATPHLSMPVFLACAAAVKHTTAKESPASASELVARAEEIVLGALARPEPSDQRVVNALEMIRSAAARHDRIRIDAIAKTQNVDPTYLGRRISAETRKLPRSVHSS